MMIKFDLTTTHTWTCLNTIHFTNAMLPTKSQNLYQCFPTSLKAKCLGIRFALGSCNKISHNVLQTFGVDNSLQTS